MKNRFTAVIGLAAMLLLLASVACTDHTPSAARTQSSVGIQTTPLPTKPVELVTGIDEKPTAIEPSVSATPVAVSPTQPTTEPASGQPSEPSMVETPAPIESVRFAVSDSDPPEYTLQITSGIPSGCVKFNGYETLQEGNTIFVNVTNMQPAQAIPCTAIYGQHEGEVVLDGGFVPGESYTVVVNGNLTNSFTARDPEGVKMAVAESPIERVEVTVSDANPPEYFVQVISRLPLGSSCSKFNGYDLSRRGARIIRVTVTHLEVKEIMPCTRDLPVAMTEILLGTEFNSGESYKVIVNGEVTNSFVGRDTEGGKKVVKESPVESVELIILESFPPQYRIKVVSTMSGSSCSQFNGYDISCPFSNTIHVKVTYLFPAGEVMCTMDIAYAETDISLGSDFVSKEEYTVAVNGVTETFIAQ